MSWWSDVVDALANLESGGLAYPSGPASAQQVGSAVQGPWQGFITLVEAIWAGATDGKFWRSFGWLILGIVLMFLGIAWWIGPSAARRSPAGIVAGQLT